MSKEKHIAIDRDSALKIYCILAKCLSTLESSDDEETANIVFLTELLGKKLSEENAKPEIVIKSKDVVILTAVLRVVTKISKDIRSMFEDEP